MSAVPVLGSDRRALLKRSVQFAGLAVAIAIALSQLSRLHASSTLSHHWETPLPAVILGTIIGITYGLLGVGLVLVYRTNRIVNFAHGEIGAFAASFFGIAVTRWHVPYWVAFPVGLAVGGAVGALAETAVIRPACTAEPSSRSTSRRESGAFARRRVRRGRPIASTSCSRTWATCSCSAAVRRRGT